MTDKSSTNGKKKTVLKNRVEVKTASFKILHALAKTDNTAKQLFEHYSTIINYKKQIEKQILNYITNREKENVNKS